MTSEEDQFGLGTLIGGVFGKVVELFDEKDGKKKVSRQTQSFIKLCKRQEVLTMVPEVIYFKYSIFDICIQILASGIKSVLMICNET